MNIFRFKQESFVLMLVLAIVGGLAKAETKSANVVEIQHAQGTTVLTQIPQRVVVFDLAALDDLSALGVDIVGVPDEALPEYLVRYRGTRYTRIGTLFEPDYEALNRIKPDLIITGGRSSAKYAQLSNIAPTLDMREDYGDPIATTLGNLDMLAKSFGREQKAESLKSALENTLQSVKMDVAKRGNGLIILVTGGKISAYGPGSRFGLLHSALQIPPALPDLKPSLHGEAISPELILKANPDWLFVIDRDAAIGKYGAARQLLDNPLVRRTHAWKSDHVVYLDPINWYLVGTGIQALNKMLEQVDDAFNVAH